MSADINGNLGSESPAPYGLHSASNQPDVDTNGVPQPVPGIHNGTNGASTQLDDAPEKMNGTSKHLNGTSGEPNGPMSLSQEDLLQGMPATADRHASATRSTFEPLAVVGMAMRLPGGAHDAESFWDLLVNGKSGHCRVPKERFNVDAFYGPGKPGQLTMKSGYFLDDLNLAHVDTSFWSMTRQEAECTDPQQRLLLEVVYECLESAGAKNWRGTDVGVYVGNFGGDWAYMADRDPQAANMYRILGYDDYMLANRVSYELDLRGPAITIRTACSSSLSSLHAACQAIQGGDCSSAVVGGVNLLLDPHMYSLMGGVGILSPSGTCKAFDAGADGYGRGEAASAVYLKKLSDAVRDGDPVRGVIRAVCAGSDGQSEAIMHPSPVAHEALIRRSYKIAGIHDFSQTPVIECHGTGTYTGDPVEAGAVANVFGGHGVYIGSVKSNLGHSEGASGLSSLIKMVLALEHKTIPPSINFDTPNPDILWKEQRLMLPTTATPWPEGRAERVGINSFGIGGSNAHVILESAAMHTPPAKPLPPSTTSDAPSRPNLLVFSANQPESVQQSIERVGAYAASHPGSINDISYTLGNRRQRHSHRAYCVGSENGKLSEASRVTKAGPTPSLVFAFTGQGAQWPQMGKGLFTQEPVFRSSMTRMEESLASLATPPQWSLVEEIMKTKVDSRLSEAEFAQPCCTAIQIALVDVLRNWGVKPTAVTGHSSGEIAAAYAAGALSLPEAISDAYYRGLATISLGKEVEGGMAAIGLGKDDVLPCLVFDGVTIGCENSPSSTTLTGDLKPLQQTMDLIKEKHPNVLVRALKVDRAYHSHHIKAVVGKYQGLLEECVDDKPPEIPFFSSLTGALWDPSEPLTIQYWADNALSPVRFKTAVEAATSKTPGPVAFVEIGPHSALAGPIKQTTREVKKDVTYISTLLRGEDSMTTMLKTAGELWSRSVEVAMDRVNPESGKTLTDLPKYAWHYDGEYWHENRFSKESRHREFPHHDVLGTRVLETALLEPTWRNILRLETTPWIRDHDVAGNVLFPAAGYITMVGEALRQLNGVADFTVRSVVYQAPIVFSDNSLVEAFTTLRKTRLTDTLDSEWYDFSITSFVDGRWTKHCSGKGASGKRSSERVPDLQPLPRKVSSDSWYEALHKIGMNHGSRFTKMREISADVSARKALCTVADDRTEGESSYQLHPSTIDALLHLISVAAYRGLSRLVHQSVVITTIDEMYAREPEEAMKVYAEADFSQSGSMNGDVVAMSGGNVAFSVKGLHVSPPGGADDEEKDAHAAAELEWRDDISFLDANKLIRPASGFEGVNAQAERFCLACLVESHHQMQNMEPSKSHLQKYQDWIASHHELAVSGQYPNVEDSASICALDSTQRKNLIEDLFAQLVKNPSAAAFAEGIYSIYNRCGDIFSGQAEALDVLMEDGKLTRVYNGMEAHDHSDFFRALGHHKPDMKVLEVGAGTGGLTYKILSSMRNVYGDYTFGSYTYTDISAGFFVTAKERFKDVEGIEYRVLDISQDPLEQGFEAESFDLIVGTNVLHATPSLRETLSNARKLLRADGRLFIRELDPIGKWINYVMGTLSGWWLGEQDGRPSEPYVSAQRWEEELKKVGLSCIDAVAYDGHLCNAIVARPPPAKLAERLTILCRNRSEPRTEDLVRSLRKSYELDFCTLEEKPKPGQEIVAVLDLEGPFLHGISDEDFVELQAFIANVQEAGILWITPPIQIGSQQPNYGLASGFARTLRGETGLDFATLELESFDDAGWKAAEAVLAETARRGRHDREYVFTNGTIKVGRYQWYPLSKRLLLDYDPSCTKRLEIERPGSLQTLTWKQYGPKPLQPHEVEVETRAVGLNFKDIVISMGIIDTFASDLGHESSGIVTKVGSNVQHLKTGDRVMALGGESFATVRRRDGSGVKKIPNSLSFVDAATMPVVHCTVIYSLEWVARLEKDQTVLIHSATGGVGISAIQVARMIGAKILCTVGSEEKVQHLIQHWGIPREDIFHSRDDSFLPGVLQRTGGKGADVVLNSLSGELLHASWRCVAEFGTLVELGKRDLIGRGALAMDPFADNRSYVGVDLAHIYMKRPRIIASVMGRLIELLEAGHVKPISPLTEWPAAKVEDAIRSMQKGLHVGKNVVTFPSDSKDLVATPGARGIPLRSDASYLLVGGMGGLGRSMASWLAEAGAKHLVFFSRSVGKVTADDPFVQELVAQGCSVNMVSGDVANLQDVKRAVASAPTPIAGVFQASMIIRIAMFRDMKYNEWREAIQPKVQGTWNLHHALQGKGQALDFFVLFSSVGGIVENGGQANYAAANTFLDTFVQYRHSLGLPASAVDLGAVEGIGYIARDVAAQKSVENNHSFRMREQAVLDAIQLAMLQSGPAQQVPERYVSTSQISTGMISVKPLTAPDNRNPMKHDARMAMHRARERGGEGLGAGGAAAGTEELTQLLRDARRTPALLEEPQAATLLGEAAAATLAKFLMSDRDGGAGLPLDVPLADLGVDSLISMELRNWVRLKVGAELPVLEVVNARSLTHLGELAAAKLKEKLQAGQDARK